MRVTFCATLAVALGTFVLGCKKREALPADEPATPSVTPAPDAKPSDAARKRGTFTVGKNTTYVTGPLDATGHVDYVAALDERMREGVTPENNANVAIWKVIGPSPPRGGTAPPIYFEKMGVPALPAEGSYFVSLKTYCERHAPGQEKASSEAAGKLTARPWKAAENATVEGWLRANEQQLDALREAVKRTHYYAPLPERRGKEFDTSRLPESEAAYELALGLVSRATLRLGRGDAAGAWPDVIACYRLGRHIGYGGMPPDGVMSYIIELIAANGAAAFLDAGKPDAKTLEGCLGDLLALRRQSIADRLDQCDRFWMLKLVMDIDRYGVPAGAFHDENQRTFDPGLNDDLLEGIDWNPVLEGVNGQYDRLAAVFRNPSWVAGGRELRDLQASARDAYTQFVKGGAPASLRSAPSAIERGRAFARMWDAYTLSQLTEIHVIAARGAQWFDVIQAGYAIAWHHRDKGRYPTSLDELAPKYLKAVPKDAFSGYDLQYRADANGFLVYGIGANRRDEGGRKWNDQMPGDDIAVRISLPPKP